MDWKRAFEAISTALTVVAGANDIPGVNLIPYVGTIANAAKAIQTGLSLGIKVAPYIEAVHDTFSNGLPSLEKVAALDARIDELRAIVNAPLPPPEDDEPE